MEFRQLRYFVAIIDAGSLSKAAERLFVAQPALSQQMANLETELKTRLLVRSSQGVRPTEAGKALYRHARTVLRQMEQARQDVRQGSVGESGPVAVGLPSTTAMILALPLLERVRARHPGIRLQMFESMSGYLFELLANGRLDLAILFRDMETRGVSVLPLLDEDLFLVGDAGLDLAPRARECPLHRLDGVPLVLPSSTQGLRLLVERSFAQAGCQLNVVADIDSLPLLINAARERVACTILPACAVAPRDGAPPLPVRKLSQPGISRPLGLCWPNSVPRTSAALGVQETLVELVHELVREGRWTGVRMRPAAKKPRPRP
ncbi:MAG: LysR substrate-binding domain-containing protein [Pseudomonadota bacterium]|jgi:LysR family nitrogen assimilation transcriptional regulator